MTAFETSLDAQESPVRLQGGLKFIPTSWNPAVQLLVISQGTLHEEVEAFIENTRKTRELNHFAGFTLITP